MTFDPTSVEVTCVTLPKDHCVQVPWEYTDVCTCRYSDQFCKNYHIHTHTTYTHTYRISDHIVSFWTAFRRDNYHRFKFLIMQALNWYMICGYSSLFCPAKINILCWFSFVFYCFVACLTGYISVCNLATLRSFCGSRSHIGQDFYTLSCPIIDGEGTFKNFVQMWWLWVTEEF